MPDTRTVKTASGAAVVQIVYSSRRGARKIEHLGSAHDGAAQAMPLLRNQVADVWGARVVLPGA